MASDNLTKALEREIVGLYDNIQRIKRELAVVQHREAGETMLDSVADQLKAISDETSGAAQAIMAATEAIEEVNQDLMRQVKFIGARQYFESISKNVGKIFEACSFHDITGQRLSRIVTTINAVEGALNSLVVIVGKDSIAALPYEPVAISKMDGDDCSVTFEQSYGGVEGDSASLAELVAILSALSGVPLRQDLAITGSVNQHGDAQAIGGVTYKVEGYHRACKDAGRLTGKQGVVLPVVNARNLVLDAETTEAVAAGKFHLYPVETVEQAVELFTGVAAGKPNAKGEFPTDSVFGRAMATLSDFDEILTQRKRSAT